MKIIALPVETKVRELDGKFWLALNLAARGYRVALGELTELKANLHSIRPNVYVGDSAVEKESRLILYEKLKNANIMVAVFDTEGGIIYSQDYYRGRLSKNVLKYVDLYLAWGEETANIFREHLGTTNIRVYVTGNPSFDLLSKRYRSYYLPEYDEIKNRYNKFVLINTHFGFFNHYDNEKYVFPLVSKFPGLYNFKKALFNEFINAIRYLSVHYPQINFIIRPHPSENFDTYRSLFLNSKNVYVEHQYSVHPWALAASMVIHNNCTTGVESVLLDRPVISYNPIQNDRWDVFLPTYVSRKALSVSELSEAVDQFYVKLDRSVELSVDQTNEIQKSLHLIDGNSAQRICNAFDHELQKEFDILPIKDGIWKHFSVIKRLLKKRTKKTMESSSYLNQKFFNLNFEELFDKWSRLKKISGFDFDIKISPFNKKNNLFWICRG